MRRLFEWLRAWRQLMFPPVPPDSSPRLASPEEMARRRSLSRKRLHRMGCCGCDLCYFRSRGIYPNGSPKRDSSE